MSQRLVQLAGTGPVSPGKNAIENRISRLELAGLLRRILDRLRQVCRRGLFILLRAVPVFRVPKPERRGRSDGLWLLGFALGPIWRQPRRACRKEMAGAEVAVAV